MTTNNRQKKGNIFSFFIFHFSLIVLFSAVTYADFTRNNATGIVTDNTTALQWQDDTVGDDMSWESAITHCESLSLGEYTDWRLPNFNELYYIADRSKRGPALDSIFQNVVGALYWSSSTVVGDEGEAWGVNFYYSYGAWNDKSWNRSVRCVRAGQ